MPTASDFGVREVRRLKKKGGLASWVSAETLPVYQKKFDRPVWLIGRDLNTRENLAPVWWCEKSESWTSLADPHIAIYFSKEKAERVAFKIACAAPDLAGKIFVETIAQATGRD